MFSADVRFEGFTATDWTRVLSLFRPRRAAGEARDPARPHGGVVAVHKDGRLLKLVHTAVGRLRLDEARAAWPLAVDELARRHDASWAAVLELGALEAIMEGFGAKSRRTDDATTQLLHLVELAQIEVLRRRIELWPRRLRGVPIPSPAVVHGTMDALCPVGKTMLLGAFEAGELWTMVALRRGAGGLDLILGPDEVRADMGLLAGDWRRDHRHLARAVEHRGGPLAFGCYAEVATLRRLEVDPTPGAWARAAAVRDVILAPLPAPLAIPLGLDAGRAAFAALRSAAERLDPLGVAAPALERLRERIVTASQREPAEGEGHERGPVADLVALLGFHPLELLRKLLSRER
ncbi:MAG TPA: hypothetical protein VHB21_24065 [Minicystis sp.]|nr:hypothetical protein [Minicystis sp.]